jgi:hypothetical protein
METRRAWPILRDAHPKGRALRMTVQRAESGLPRSFSPRSLTRMTVTLMAEECCRFRMMGMVALGARRAAGAVHHFADVRIFHGRGGHAHCEKKLSIMQGASSAGVSGHCRGTLAGRKVPLPDSCSSKAAFYSITSSALTSSDGGIVRPNVFAVRWLTTVSNFVGCSIGKSAGFAPLRMRST